MKTDISTYCYKYKHLLCIPTETSFIKLQQFLKFFLLVNVICLLIHVVTTEK